MAEIYKRNGIIWITYSIYGKRYRESLGIKDTRENRILAKKIKLQKEADILNGVHPLIKKIKKKTLIEAFKDFEKTKENKSESTRRIYDYSYKKLLDFTGDIEIRKVTEDVIDEFEKYLKVSKGSLEIIFRHLRIIFEYFRKMRIIDFNPVPRKQSVEKKINVISREEMDLILKLLKKHNENQYKTIKLLIMTGLRVSELIRLEFEDIDFKRNIIYIKNNKGKRIDQFPLYRELRLFLEIEWKELNGKVCPYKTKEALSFFRHFLKRNNFRHYSIHEIRKTFLSRLANAGMSLFDLQKIARHKDIKTTQKYYLEAEYERIGNKINDVILGTIEGTMSENALKIAQK
ncbi:MAG: tyrosine-type recombinase/integrase [Bacteroidota bacterium]